MTRYFATTPKGLEPILVKELEELGAKNLTSDRGGVYFEGDFALALRANVWLRSAMRVLEPLCEALPAKNAKELYHSARSIRWRDRVNPRGTISIEAHGKTTELIHTHFTGQKIKDAIVDQLRDTTGNRPSVDPKTPDVLIIGHLQNEKITLYADLSGESLHRRGYRIDSVEAPLKEPIAAALLLWSGFRGDRPFLDPMCGSGTFAIEAALLALHRAPNVHKHFGVERWPSFGEKEASLLASIRKEAIGKEKPDYPIFASDIAERAVSATRVNAKAAKVAKWIQITKQDVCKVPVLSPPGFIALNPPYGERLDNDPDLPLFYEEIGKHLREFGGSNALMLTSTKALSKAMGLMPKETLRVFNGPIECIAARYEIWEKRSPSV